MFKNLTRLGIVALAAVLPLTACDGGPTSGETGLISILLTDEPGDFHEAVVTIEGIYLQGEEGEDAERVWLREDAVTTDLLTLANDVLGLVDGAEIAAGTYAQLRFVISGAYIGVENETGDTLIYASSNAYAEEHAGQSADGDLQMPSFAQTGIKVNLPNGGVQVSGTQTVLLVDFNVAQSFGQLAGASGTWVMTPVINAENFELSSSVTVSLALDEGVELPEGFSLADFAAHLADVDENTKEEGFVEADGSFTASFLFLLPGESWELTLIVPEGLSVEIDPVLPLTVETLSGTDVEVPLTITAASEG